MGTRFEFVLCGPDAAHLRAVGEQAIDEVRAWHRRLTRFEEGSPVARATALAGTGRGVGADADLAEALELAEAFWRDTAGAFDVTLGTARADPARRPRVDERGELRLARGVTLDFGGLGKGLALDAAATVVRDAGVTGAFLPGGTSSGVALGAGPDAGGWRVRLGARDEDPVVRVRDAAFSVSCRRVERAGAGVVAHTLDPRGGVWERSGMAESAAVIATSAAAAEAWSTALVVLGGVPEGTLPRGVRAAYVVPGGCPRAGAIEKAGVGQESVLC
jgi:thiamine biosynthesis lipoprotein